LITEPRASAAITRAAQILEALSSQYRALSLAELGKLTDIPKSTLHGLMSDMVGTGLVRRVSDGGGYILGSRVLEFAHQYLDNDLLVVSFMDASERFIDATGETVHLGRLEETDAVYLARRQGAGALRLESRVGTRFPASSSGIGKAMLSLLSDDELRVLYEGLDELPVMTSRSIRTLAELLAHLERIRQPGGYAIDEEESQAGLRCFGAPLFRMGGQCFAVSTSITATGHSRGEEDRIIAALMELRDELAGNRLAFSKSLESSRG
jgi:DNA-binding IclR family transcriptional regulator